LFYTADVTLLEALTGFELKIEHLDGRFIYVKSNKGEIIKPGILKTVKECGMPFFEAPYKYGNLYLSFNIIFPEKLDGDQKTSLFKLFPKLKQEEIKEKIDDVYTMTDYNENDENTHHSGGNKKHSNEEDEENEGDLGGGRRVKCANQ